MTKKSHTLPTARINLKLKFYVKLLPKRIRSICQYCGRRGVLMTTDHVIPRSTNGTDTWENLVCACTECNSRKGNMTPAQAMMPLRRKPKKPHYFTFAVASLGDVPDGWRQYLFMS